MSANLTEKDLIRGNRLKISTVCDADLVDYEELYDELFSRMEQSVGAQIRPVGDDTTLMFVRNDDGGDPP